MRTARKPPRRPRSLACSKGRTKGVGHSVAKVASSVPKNGNAEFLTKEAFCNMPILVAKSLLQNVSFLFYATKRLALLQNFALVL